MEITTVGDIPDALYIVTVSVVCVVINGRRYLSIKRVMCLERMRCWA